jgi:hypothetical protein
MPAPPPAAGRAPARLAVTGHRGLAADTERLIDDAVRTQLAHRADTDLIGLSCLADGADMIFARAVLDAGGRLTVYVPALAYRSSLPSGQRPGYDALLARATRIVRLPHTDVTIESYVDASVAMVGAADELLAVWDGRPARGPGGTADVVATAHRRGIPVTVLWPAGAHRT